METAEENRPELTIREFLEGAPGLLELELHLGERSIDDRTLDSDRIQKLGLALAGYPHYLHSGRLQVIGQSEISYLNQLSAPDRRLAVENIDLDLVSCILVTKGLRIPVELEEALKTRDVPVLLTRAVSSIAISEVSGYLRKKLAPSITIHGVLLGMYGKGILLLGESGIGKSECALDLITKGYRLISDDSVTIKRIGDVLEGSSPDLTREHLEIRGLGILNVRDLFGVSATGESKEIDLCIEFCPWEEMTEVDRLGLETAEEDICGIRVPKYLLPVSSGRNLATLVETAVRIHLLKASGKDSARKLIEKHSKAVGGTEE